MQILNIGWIIREFFKIVKNYLLLPCDLLSPIVVSDVEVAFSLAFRRYKKLLKILSIYLFIYFYMFMFINIQTCSSLFILLSPDNEKLI